MSDSDAWVSAVVSCSFEHSVGGIGLWVPKTISNHFSLFAEQKTLQLQGNCPPPQEEREPDKLTVFKF